MSKRDLAPPPGVYKLEIEVAPKKWHKEMIAKVCAPDRTLCVLARGSPVCFFFFSFFFFFA